MTIIFSRLIFSSYSIASSVGVPQEICHIDHTPCAALTQLHQATLEESVLDQQAYHGVRIHVGRWAAVLEIPFASQLHRQGNSDRGTAISHTKTEGVDIAGLMRASQAVLVTSAILSDMLRMALGQALNSSFDGSHATISAHALSGVVGMGTGAVPVTLHGLGSKRGNNSKLLTQAVQKPASNHDLVTSFKRPSGANLELPLTRHHLGVDARDGEPSLDAGVKMSLSQRTTIH